MSLTAAQIRAATQQGGRPDGWPENEWSLIVWAAIGSGAWPAEAPHAEIAEQQRRGGDPAVILATLAPELDGQPVDVLLIAAWAGLARYATEQRNAAIRSAPAGLSDRQIAARCGLSQPGVSKIRRQ